MKNYNKISINLELLHILGISINLLFTILYFHQLQDRILLDFEVQKEDVGYLHKKGYLRLNDEKSTTYYVTQKGLNILDQVIFSTKVEKKVEKKKIEYVSDDLIKEFRYVFKDLRVGSMGGLNTVRKKLTRWMRENPEVTFEEIIAASKLYVESLNGDYRYLQRADYFIFKSNHRKEEDSRLSLFIEEGKKEITNSDWGNNMV